MTSAAPPIRMARTSIASPISRLNFAGAAARGRNRGAIDLSHEANSMYQVLKLAFLSTILVLTGCAANVQRQGGAEQKFALSLAAAKRVTLDVRGSKEVAASKDWEQFRNEWRVGMTEATAAAGLTLAPAETAIASATEPSTLVTVNINDYRYITRGARVAAGIMTGNAYIDADVSFSELPGATPMGARKYATTSSAMQGVFAPMTENQIRSISDEIVKDIARR